MQVIIRVKRADNTITLLMSVLSLRTMVRESWHPFGNGIRCLWQGAWSTSCMVFIPSTVKEDVRFLMGFFSSYHFCSTKSTTHAKQLDLAVQRRQLDEELSRSWSDNREPSESYQEWALEALKWFIISHWSSVVETERKKNAMQPLGNVS